ncbi:MAG: hypothetical protein QXN15_03535 [Candidatus Jordarchaeales archaeon]|nr:hypothetical protein [Candidatus Jordarchaeia archaeon]
MRHFYIILNSIPKFSRKNVDCGDVSDDVAELCSCIRAALFLSHDIRRDVKVHLVLLEEKREVVIDGGSIRYLSPDERSICMLLIKLSEKRARKPWRGVYVNDLTSIRDVFSPDALIITPSKSGADLRQVKNLKEVAVIIPLTPSDNWIEHLNNARTLHVRTWGKLLPSHLITILNNQMDLAEEQKCTP